MHLVGARAQFADLTVVTTSASTNTDLVALAADPEVPSYRAIATLDQTSGRGRLDRRWVAPAGSALALSVLVRGVVSGPHASWVPLIAGLALTEALDAEWPGRFSLKWPNDVLLDGLKVCGILVEVAGSTDAVIGAGLNLLQVAKQLPTSTATSLARQGLRVDDVIVDRVVAGYLRRLRHEFDTPMPGLRERVAARCETLGRRVRIELPTGPSVEGTATGLDADGRLVVRTDSGNDLVVAVGDVIHVRAV